MHFFSKNRGASRPGRDQKECLVQILHLIDDGGSHAMRTWLQLGYLVGGPRSRSLGCAE